MCTAYVIVPVLNEKPNLPRLLASWRTLQTSCPAYRFRFVLVDDGSQDGTGDAARAEGSDLDLDILRHERNRGPGAAFGTAFEFLEARVQEGDRVVTMEGDNTSRVETLKIMLRRLDEEGTDVALASPYAYGGGMVGTPLHRLFLSQVANGLVKSLLGIHGIHTMSSFFRACDASMLRRLQKRYGARVLESRGFECMLELLKKLIIEGATITEVPMRLDGSLRQGKSKMRIGRTIVGYIRVMLRMRAWV